MVVNLICTLILARFRTGAGSLTAAAFLAARNDVLINLAIIAVAGLTAWVGSGWPDLVLGTLILVLNLGAAKEVWETAQEESLAAKALAGDLDD